MNIDVSAGQGEFYSIRVNGKIICEGLADSPHAGQDFNRQLEAARAHRALPQIFATVMREVRQCQWMPDEGCMPEEKQACWMEGLADGYHGETKLAKGIRISGGDSYKRGFETGSNLRKAINTAAAPSKEFYAALSEAVDVVRWVSKEEPCYCEIDGNCYKHLAEKALPLLLNELKDDLVAPAEVAPC